MLAPSDSGRMKTNTLQTLDNTIYDELVCVCELRILITQDKMSSSNCSMQLLIKIRGRPETLWRHTGCVTLS
jgi:hypothetical protein